MSISPTRQLLVRKPSSKPSCIDYVVYDSQGHILVVGMLNQKLSFIGVPYSTYMHMRYSDDLDETFMEEVFNHYPVLVDYVKTSYRPKRRKNRCKQSTKSPY